MMQPESSLSNGKLDEEPYDFEYYGQSMVMILMVQLHWTIMTYIHNYIHNLFGKAGFTLKLARQKS